MKNKVFIIISVLVLLTALMTGIYIYKTNGSNTYMTATVTTIENSEETVGFMILDEEVINISSSNFCRMYYSDGEKIAKNAKIISLYNNASDGNMIAELDAVEEKLSSLNDDYVNLTASDALKIENYIDDGINEMAIASYKGRLSEAKLAADKLETLFSIKHSTGNASKATEAELLKEKASLEGRLSTDKNDILSPIGGIFVSKTDGYEGMLSYERAISLSVGEFNEIMKEEKKPTDGACKVVNNYRWHMACIISSDKLLSATVGSKVNLIADGDDTATAEIVYISEPQDGKCVVTLSSNDDFCGIDEMRKVNVKVVFERITGYVVPSRAFHMYNGEYGVFAEQSNKTVFKKTNIIYSSDEYSVVPQENGGISLYDTILIDGDLSEFYD